MEKIIEKSHMTMQHTEEEFTRLSPGRSSISGAGPLLKWRSGCFNINGGRDHASAHKSD